MTDLFRGIVTFVCAVFAYFFVYWVPMALLLPTGFGWALAGTGVALAAAVYTWRWVWPRTQHFSGGLASAVVMGALVTGGIGFAGGFFGPMILAPGANQGPLLGLFITGPLGFVFGAAGGAVYWFARGRAGGTS
jgi:hypothetical protein